MNEPANMKELLAQLEDMKAQILGLGRAVSERADTLASSAQPYADEAGHRLMEAGKQARVRGRAMVEAVQENPGTASSIAVTAGLMGLAVGYLLASSKPERPTSRWHF